MRTEIVAVFYSNTTPILIRFAFCFSCEFGEMLTNHFEQLNDAFGLCNWHLFPIEMQQMFLIVMPNAQQSTIVRGYGNTPCARGAFKQVNDPK